MNDNLKKALVTGISALYTLESSISHALVPGQVADIARNEFITGADFGISSAAYKIQKGYLGIDPSHVALRNETIDNLANAAFLNLKEAASSYHFSNAPIFQEHALYALVGVLVTIVLGDLAVGYAKKYLTERKEQRHLEEVAKYTELTE